MYIKNLKKKYQEKWENAYLIVKNARTSRALRWALDPPLILAHFARPTLFRYVSKISEKFSGPSLDQMLDPLVNNTILRYDFWIFDFEIFNTQCAFYSNLNCK